MNTPTTSTSLPLPTSASGTQKRLTLIGGTTSEGAISTSGNGKYAVLAGYDLATGQSLSASAARVVGRIAAPNVIDTSTSVTFGSSVTARGAASDDGTHFWISNSTSGGVGNVNYIASLGASTGVQILTTPSSPRSIAVFNGQLYGCSGSSGYTDVFSIGSGYPTTATTVANLTGLTTSNMSPYGFAFIAAHPGLAGNPMTMYMADDGNGTTTHRGVTRWTLVNGTWTKSPTTSTGAFTQLLNQTNGAFAVAAWSDGVNVQLAYTIGGTQCGGATSCVYRVTDSGSTQTSQAAFTVPSTNNALYRGITIAPHL